ncbi:MAG: MFS transporter [Oscillospiraceae bacterium]|nr:MFS transporter [Oscillospiraceae bacterium]
MDKTLADQKMTVWQKVAFGIGAVGKDMVYALSSSYILYYYQDLLHLSATFVGLILMIARVFDAFNDPFMGIIVQKTNTKWGRFRPWLFTGTVLNAFVLYALFAAPASLDNAGLMVYFSVVYILWGVTYTMMDIPYWSMIPAVTNTPAETENLSVIGRTCAGVGSALIAMLTMLLVGILGGGNDVVGLKYFALGVSVIFIVTEIICCFAIKEHKVAEQKTATVGEMFKSLFENDQALIVVLSIVLINSALYLTSNLIIYFFKYDMGGEGWRGNYTLFSTVGGGFQILGMMILYPILRKKLSNISIFKVSVGMSILGYILILAFCLFGFSGNLILITIPGILVFAANGMLSVLTTVFLSSTVDYGELKTGHREESVIFSMQTFVVKLASGLSVFITGIGLDAIGLVGNADDEAAVAVQSASTLTGLRLLMTVGPVILLIIVFFFFGKKFKLDDNEIEKNARLVKERNA